MVGKYFQLNLNVSTFCSLLNFAFQMWALSPSLFDLYCEHLDIVRPSISVQYPALQYAILQSLYSHANTYVFWFF